MIRPVVYSSQRPLVYRTAADMWRHAMYMTQSETAESIMDAIIYTKSEEWAYEEEQRLVIHDYIPEGKLFNYVNLHPEELVGVYLGCRTSDADALAIAARAVRMNKDVRIYRAAMDPREYQLRFNEFGPRVG